MKNREHIKYLIKSFFLEEFNKKLLKIVKFTFEPNPYHTP